MRCTGIAILFGLLLAARTPIVGEERAEAPPGRPEVLLIRLENATITPITTRFVERAVREAEEQSAACLVIVLDTPGGLLEATRSMVRTILASEVPVVVYVAPPGARAASAGVFITLAAHVAAMAPGTNIGAAHPVQIGGLPSQEPPDRANGEAPRDAKLLNDTVAWSRSLAELRGRNAEWAAAAVTQSASASATEAARENAIDLLADSVGDLVDQLDGREVVLPTGSVRLGTAGATVRTIEMWWTEQLLDIISSPNIAFLLLMFGFYGILFELYSPGWGVAGTLGAILLVLAFFGLAVLPINYVGLALIAVALALLVAEVFVTSFGALTVGGVVCLILGGIMLVESPGGFVGVSLRVLIPVAAATAVITLFLIGRVVQTHRRGTQTGSEGLLGARGVADEDFVTAGAQYRGRVQARGELWRAVSSRPVVAGQALKVLQRQGLTLSVEPIEASEEQGARDDGAEKDPETR